MCGVLCPITISVSLWLSRYLGIDDLTLGLWLGALILSLSYQFYLFLKKRKFSFPFSFLIILIVFWFLSFLPIFNRINWAQKESFFCGLPRVIFGSFLGMLALFLSDFLNNKFLEKYHGGKVYFTYQRVIVPLIILIIISIIIEVFIC
ncbi:MAG: hypothetical protein ACP5OX_00385 [Minisyncoccia bacterium]